MDENEKHESEWWASQSGEASQVVALYRVKDGRELLLDSFDVSPETVPDFVDFQLQVKERYGGGLYVAVVRGERGQFGKRMPFGLYGLPKDEQATAAPAAAPESGMDKLAALLLQQQQASEQRLMAVLEKLADKPEPAPAPQQDPFELMDKMASILNKNGAAPTPQKSLAEQLGELQAVQEFFEKMGGGGGGGDGWAALQTLGAGLTELLKENAVTERVKVAARVKQQRDAKAALPAAEAAAPAAPAAPVAAGNPAPAAGLLGVLQQLVDAAAQGIAPAQIAPQLIEAAPSVPVLRQLLESEDAIARLESLNPAVGQHFDWFADLANETLALIEDAERGLDDDGAGQPAAAVAARPKAPAGKRGKGNGANAGTDGSTRAPRKAAAGSPRTSAGAGG